MTVTEDVEGGVNEPGKLTELMSVMFPPFIMIVLPVEKVPAVAESNEVTVS